MSKISWKAASKTCHPVRDENKEHFKYTNWYEIMAITNDGEVITDIFYEDGELYQDFDHKIDLSSDDWNVMHISNDEGSFKIPWIKIDKWCYMEDVVKKAMEDI